VPLADGVAPDNLPSDALPRDVWAKEPEIACIDPSELGGLFVTDDAGTIPLAPPATPAVLTSSLPATGFPSVVTRLPLKIIAILLRNLKKVLPYRLVSSHGQPLAKRDR
jgi:hypothetical protein